MLDKYTEHVYTGNKLHTTYMYMYVNQVNTESCACSLYNIQSNLYYNRVYVYTPSLYTGVYIPIYPTHCARVMGSGCAYLTILTPIARNMSWTRRSDSADVSINSSPLSSAYDWPSWKRGRERRGVGKEPKIYTSKTREACY